MINPELQNRLDWYNGKHLTQVFGYFFDNNPDKLIVLEKISESFKNISSVYATMDKVAEYKNYAHKTVLTTNLLLEAYLGKCELGIPFKREITYFLPKFECLFCSENLELMPRYAQNYLEYDASMYELRKEKNSKHYHTLEIKKALCYLILGDIEQAKYFAELAKADKKPYACDNGFNDILAGLIERDKALIVKGIEDNIKWFVRSKEMRESIMYPYNHEMMGILCFARQRGLYIDFKSKNIHPEMIKPVPQGFVYEGIPEVYAALEKARIGNTSLAGKIKAWFKGSN